MSCAPLRKLVSDCSITPASVHVHCGVTWLGLELRVRARVGVRVGFGVRVRVGLGLGLR